MDYKLELSLYSCIHPVFHVFFLKKVINDKILVQTILPNINEEGKIILKLKTIPETRIKQFLNRAIIEYLIKWKRLQVEEEMWEVEFFIHQHLQLIKC
jgi:hypothetical protein